MITLRQLEIFLAVARREHVTAAARDVHLSQSAVSAALAELAERLAGPLFDRAGRRLVLNDRGRRLADDAAELLARAESLVRGYTARGRLSGRLRIGASSTIGSYLLPGLVGAFLATHPEVSVDLEIGNSERVEQQVVARRLDLAFIEGPPLDPASAAIAWRADELVVFVGRRHALAKARRLPVSRLGAERWVLREPGSGTRSVFEAALRRHGVQVHAALTCGSSEAVKEAVRAGLGIGCLSRLTLRRELAAKEFVLLRVPGLDLGRQLWRIQRRGSFESALVQACVRHCAARG